MGSFLEWYVRNFVIDSIFLRWKPLFVSGNALKISPVSESAVRIVIHCIVDVPNVKNISLPFAFSHDLQTVLIESRIS